MHQSPAAGAADAAPGLHAALRAGTRERHALIEQALALHTLADEPQGLARYGRVLQALALFQQHWQPHMRAALPRALQPWLDRSPRAEWLAADLAALGLPVPSAAEAGQAVPVLPWPERMAPVAALASLYVLEGSALGGQVIVRGLARRAPALAVRAARYFSGHGEATGAGWRAFCAELARFSPEGEGAAARTAQAVAAANATFDALLCCAQAWQATVPAAPAGRGQAA